MSNKTIIRLNENSPESAEWIEISDQGRQISAPQSGALQNLPNQLRSNPIFVLLPGTETTTKFLKLPIKSFQKIRAAIPFALEEELAGDIKDLHFSFIKIKGNDEIPIVIIEKKRLNYYQQLLDDCNIEAHLITSELFGLEMIKNTITAMIEPNKIMINNGSNISVVIENDNSHDINNIINQIKESANYIQVYLREDIKNHEHLSNDLKDNHDNIDIKLIPSHSLQKLSQTIINSNSVNLLQGKYAAKIDLEKYFKPWKYAAISIIALCFTLLLNKALLYNKLTNDESDLATRFANEYKKFDSRIRNINDPIQLISALQINGPIKSEVSLFLGSLDNLSEALNRNNAYINSITYQDNIVNIRITSPDVTSLDKIRRNINQNSVFLATILSTNQISNNIESRLELRLRGS
jgi:general secretion pathway protein L